MTKLDDLSPESRERVKLAVAKTLALKALELKRLRSKAKSQEPNGKDQTSKS